MTMMALVLAGGLSVGLSVPPSCLPLEEVPIVITYEANAELRDMVVAGGGAAVPDSVWFEIDGPNGVVAYHEAPRAEVIYGRETWSRGTKRSSQVLLIGGWLGTSTGTAAQAFPVAGSYRLRVHYDDERTNRHAASQWEHIEVNVPREGGDAVVLEGLRRGVPFAELRRDYPESRYFAFARLEDIRIRSSRIGDGVDPDSGLRADVPLGELAAWRQARYRDVLSALEAEADRSESVEREALSRARTLAAHIGDAARLAVVEARLERKYPEWRSIPDLR